MKALISGSSATAAIFEENSIFALVLEESRQWRRVPDAAVPFLFHGATDVSKIRVSTRQEALTALTTAQMQHDSLQLLLLLLEPYIGDENRLEIARWLEGAVQDSRVARFLADRLYTAPLPAGAAYKQALHAAQEVAARGRLALLLKRVGRSQVAISAVWEAWVAAAAQLKAPVELRLRRKISVDGRFREAVGALLSGDYSRLERWGDRSRKWATNCGDEVVGGVEVVLRWTALLSVRKRVDFITIWFTRKLQDFCLIERTPMLPFVKALRRLQRGAAYSGDQATYKALLSLQLNTFSQAPAPKTLLRCASLETLPSDLVDNALRNTWIVRSEVLRKRQRGMVLPWTSIARSIAYPLSYGDSWLHAVPMEAGTKRVPKSLLQAFPSRPSVQGTSLPEGLSVEGKPVFRLESTQHRDALQKLEKISFEFATYRAHAVPKRPQMKRRAARV